MEMSLDAVRGYGTGQYSTVQYLPIKCALWVAAGLTKLEIHLHQFAGNELNNRGKSSF